jgi:hypothetical protein
LQWTRFFREIGVGIPEAANILEASISSGSYWVPYRGLCICVERPAEVHVEDAANNRKRAHCTTGPAFLFRDGWPIYFLHGIVVPSWVVETKPEEMDAKKVLALTNIDQRREAIRKMGIDLFVSRAGAKELHKEGAYSLLEVSFGEDRKGRYLKMLNPSIGIWHVEGVPPTCQTVAEALHARKPKWMQEIPVSNDGADWEQQGDVVLVPRGATALKPRPAILT